MTNQGSLPAHLERFEQVVNVEDKACACCGGDLHVIGEDVAERLDVVPATFREAPRGLTAGADSAPQLGVQAASTKIAPHRVARAAELLRQSLGSPTKLMQPHHRGHLVGLKHLLSLHSHCPCRNLWKLIRHMSFPSSTEKVSSQIRQGVTFSVRMTAGTPVAAAAAPATTPWDLAADVVIAGSGAAAMSAAIAAATAGSSVVMIEKAAAPGRTTAKSEAESGFPTTGSCRQRSRRSARKSDRFPDPHLYRPTAPRHSAGAAEHALISTFYDEVAPAIALRKMSFRAAG